MKTPSILTKKIPAALRSVLLPAAFCATLATASAQQTYTWTGNSSQLWGTSANWVGSPALTFNSTTDIIFDNDTVVNRSNAVSINGTRTIRSLTIGANYVGTSNATFDIRTNDAFSATSTARNLTFAAASGNASINVAQSTSGTVQVRLGTNTYGNVVLNSNLDLAQNNTFFNAAGFQFDSSVTGVGTINKTGAGLVGLVRSNANWSGGMNINEGTVQVFASGNAMGTGLWTLGGGANNTTLLVGSNVTQTNSGGLVVATGAGTRTIANIGLSPASAIGNPTLSGNITLNKDATFAITEYTATTHDRMTLSGNVTGTGGLAKTNTGTLILAATNTYTGNTTVNAGTLLLQDNAELRFAIGSNGVNNALLGSGTATLNGDFRFDLTGAGTTVGNTWNIVDVGSLAETFGGTFQVFSTLGSFTNNSGVWSITENSVTYEFSQSLGTLTVIPEPSTWALLAVFLAVVVLFRRRRRTC
jgi:autotransporter-associated beta strand protein